MICVVEGEADSMAFNILSQCEVRIAKSGATFVAHRISIGSFPEGERMTVKALRTLANSLARADAYFDKINRAAMHLSQAEYDMAVDTDYNWSDLELFRLGYLQGIIK